MSSEIKNDERGAALAIAVIILAILSVVALTALAFSSTEARIAGSDLQHTQAFYAASAGLEKMTDDFSNLFRTKINPTQTDLNNIAADSPAPLSAEGFDFQQTLEPDNERLAKLRAAQGLPANISPRVNIPEGPYAGLYASLMPYKMTSMATQRVNKAEVKLEREFNNYLVPLFQFGMFSSEDLEVAPGPMMTFNGRVHSNGNIYALRNTKFLNRLTMAGEFIRDAGRGGEPNTSPDKNNVWVEVNGINVRSTEGSMKSGGGAVGGPNIVGSMPGQRGYFPGSPDGIPNPNWESDSIKPAQEGANNQFGGQILTNTTGASELKTPLELAGNSPAELIKRALPSDAPVLTDSRYENKAQIRILIDDEWAGSGAGNVAGIPAAEGVKLSAFVPTVLGGGNVLKLIDNSGTVSGGVIKQMRPDGTSENAQTVRAASVSTNSSAIPYVPPGSGVQGKILIQIVRPDGTAEDVTQQILSMGITEGEPNAIVNLQRPLWAAYVQGSRDRAGNNFDLADLIRNSQTIADGEIADPYPSLVENRGYLKTDIAAAEDDTGVITREASPNVAHNQIVPINVYNVREGWINNSQDEYTLYDRGLTSVVEINMRNLARWLDGVYDGNLLAGTHAVSTNIKGDEGYVVYVSDRRGDRVKAEYQSDGTAYLSTNGTVDNEDIYGPNNILDAGEDVIDFGWDATKGAASKKGTLQKDTAELPDSGGIGITPAANAPVAGRITRADTALSQNTTYFRRAVRLFDGESLSTSGDSEKLSPTKGITVAAENMVYIWGNYNTTGVTGIPAGGSTLNDGGYAGAQVPASIVCDAFFPLSKTWFDASSALYPEGSGNPRDMSGEAYRMADENLRSVTQGTAVRAGIIAGTNISSLTATPGRNSGGLRRNGGIVNYPRFLELWNLDGNEQSWNYTGSFIPLFHSTQAVAQWENDTSVIYMPPRRNWSFDQTFLNIQQLPPGTPYFQYVQATGFRPSLQ